MSENHDDRRRNTRSSGFVPEDVPMAPAPRDRQDSSAITPAQFVDLVLASLNEETPSDKDGTRAGAIASTADMASRRDHW
jgi:hypothetical protein